MEIMELRMKMRIKAWGMKYHGIEDEDKQQGMEGEVSWKMSWNLGWNRPYIGDTYVHIPRRRF